MYLNVFNIAIFVLKFSDALQEATQYSIPHLSDVKVANECISIEDISIASFNQFILPPLEGKRKGDLGKIGVIGGSTEYTGAPYFAAISALKVGADLVYIITTESAAPVIKSYSPDLIVYPYLSDKFESEIMSLIHKMDVIVIGPGLGRENDTLSLCSNIIRFSKLLRKPLVIDADGLYLLSKDMSIIKDYPSPGVILTPNHKEAERLRQHMPENNSSWVNFWGPNVSVLVKGHKDTFYSSVRNLHWHVIGGGSGRRAGGQGDILAGSLGTFFNWALKINLCVDNNPVQLAQSIASYVAANLTRVCNFKAYISHGRNLIASDMINEIHNAFDFLITRI